MPEKGETGEIGEKGRGPDEGLRGAFATVFRSIGIGAGGGSIAGLVALVADPTGFNAKMAGAVGVGLGALNGLSEVAAKHRRAMRDADAEPNHQARIAAERDLAACEAERLKLAAVVAELGVRIKELELVTQTYHRENQQLTAEVIDLAKRLSRLDGGPDDEHHHRREPSG